MTPEQKTEPRLFGTFGGVFTPAILTILGVIMFLRAGYVIGQAGIRDALLILLGAEAIVLLTVFSMSAIATNTPVKAGGAYYLISRVLGPQFGGAIGLALYLAQALSVPFYVLGFTQSVIMTFPSLQPHFQAIALVTVLLIFAVVYIGADWAVRAQYAVMAMLGLAIAAFMSGAIMHFDPARFAANWAPGYTAPGMNFWTMFALFFPAVTGIMAGINMSGNLRDPARALVRGTFAAVGVGALIYLLEMLLCGGAQTRAELINDPFGTLVRQAPAGTGFLVVAGVFAATISSAIGSFLTAPRVLQSLAQDRIVPGLSPFARALPEPRAATLLTLLLSVVLILAASGGASLRAFDIVAAIVSMLFLCTYGMINMAAFIESLGANPSFRPRFKLYHWLTALAGMLACAGAMLLIDPPAALMAGVLIAGIYFLISRRVYESAFGDARRGFVYAIIARNLRRLRNMRADPKNWRPSLLVMSGNPRTRPILLRYAAWLEARRGLLTAAEIIVGGLREQAALRATAQAGIEKQLRDNPCNAFVEVVIASDLDEGIRMLAQSHSLGPIKPNTVLFGWPSDSQRVAPFVRHLQDIALIGKSLVCVIDHEAENDLADDYARRRIDIWWRGRRNGSLMLIMAHLLSRNWEWRRARIRVLRRVEDEQARAPARRALASLAHAARIDAEAEVVVSSDPFPALLRRHSRDADAVLLGFDIPADGQAAKFHQYFAELADGMPTILLLHSSGETDFQA